MNGNHVLRLIGKCFCAFLTAGSLLATGAGAASSGNGTTLPDLILISQSHSPVAPYTNDDILVQVDVTNASEIPAGPFQITVYLDYIPTICAEAGLAAVQAPGLESGQTLTYSLGIAAGALSTGEHFLSIFVDSYCSVSETDEVNNSATPQIVTIAAAPAPPANDDFNSATTIDDVNYLGSVDASGATRAADDPNLWQCLRYAGMRSVWYRYTPDRDISAILDTFGANFDTMLSVWTGTRGSLLPVRCGDDSYNPGNPVASRIHVNLTSGTTYYIGVSQYTSVLQLPSTAAPGLEAAPAASKGRIVLGIPPSGQLAHLQVRPGSGPLSDFDGDLRSDAAKYDSAEAVWWKSSNTAAWYGEYMGPGAYVARSDFDGDRRTDPAKIDATNSLWYKSSNNGVWVGTYLGPGTWSIVNGSDFDGDGRTDPAHFSSDVNALWYRESAVGAWQGVYMGPGSYTPVPASDFDGDGMTDPAHFSYATKVLWYMRSSDSTWQGVYLGPGDYGYIPACDFDGDGKTDPSTFSASSNTLWYLPSGGDAWAGMWMGNGTLIYVPAVDFDGDGKTDPAEYIESMKSIWYAGSATNSGQLIDMGTGTYAIVN